MLTVYQNDAINQAKMSEAVIPAKAGIQNVGEGVDKNLIFL